MKITSWKNNLIRLSKKEMNKPGFFIIRFSLEICFVFICIISLVSCKMNNDPLQEKESGFILSSPEIGSDSLLPVGYTCDGQSSTLPLEWSGFPSQTVCFALIMHHEASPADIHWYWILYNIPYNINSLPENVLNIGIIGNNSVNGRTEYAPPCSRGPGRKDYIFTVYALSEMVKINMAPEEVNREILLNAIKNITLSSAKMTVWYSRNMK